MPGVTCPHCGNGTAHWPSENNTGVPPHRDGIAWIPGYWVVRCQACDKRLVVEDNVVEQFDEEEEKKVEERIYKAVWPLGGATVSEIIPEPIRSAVIDAHLAYAAGSKTGAIMSVRTAVERLQRHEKVSSLSALWEAKKLPESLFDTANEPRLWGHAIAHDDFDPNTVTDEHVKDLLMFVDVLLEMLYIIPAKLGRAREARKSLKEI